jgi:outer membrane protein assembly factor BamB
MSRALALLLVGVVACQPSAGHTPSGESPGDGPPATDWPMFRRDPAGTSSTPAPLAVNDAPRLAEGWSLDLGHPVYGQPVAAGGVAFVTTADVGTVTAVDLASGAVRWAATLDAPTHATCEPRERHPGIWGAAAVSEGIVYVAAPDGAVHALDAATGAARWAAPVAAPSPDGELLVASVVVAPALGKLYVGVASSTPCHEVAGRIAAVDLASGAVTAQPLAPDGQRGAALWSTVAVDEAEGRVYAATSSPPAGVPAAVVPLSQAIVALDARTLAPLDHWQNPTPLEDSDFGGSPLLLEAGGKRLVAAVNKDGVLYVLDRMHLSAGPVWTRRIAVLDPGDPAQGGDPLAGWGSMAAPALVHGLLVVGGGRTETGAPGAVWALDPETGAVRWVHETPGAVLQPVAAVGDVLFAVSMQPSAGGSALEVLDASTGAALARWDASVWSLAPATYASGRVLWPDAAGRVRTYTLP